MEISQALQYEKKQNIEKDQRFSLNKKSASKNLDFKRIYFEETK